MINNIKEVYPEDFNDEMKEKYDLKYYINVVLGISQDQAAQELDVSTFWLNRVANGQKSAGFGLRKKILNWSDGLVDVAKLAMIEKGK